MTGPLPRRVLTVSSALLLLVTAMAQFLAPSAMAAASLITLTLDSSGEPISEVPLVVKSGQESGTVLFFAHYSGEEALSAVSIKAPTAPSVAVTSVTGEATFTIPANKEPVALIAAIAGVTEQTDLRLPLVAVVSGNSTAGIGTLHVIREDAPSLATVGGITSLTHSQAASRFMTTFDVVAGTTPVEATIRFGSFQDAQSRLTALDVAVDGKSGSSGDPVGFAPGALRSVTVSGTLPRPGVYSGSVTFLYGRAGRLTLTLTVTRTQSDQTVVVDPSPPATAAEIPFRLPIGTVSAIDVNTAVSFREDQGQEPTMNFKVIQVTRTEGTEERQVALDAVVEPASLSFQPLDSTTTKVTVKQITQPGAYTVTLRGTTPNNKPLDTTAKLLVRDSPLTAAVLILVGTLVSAGLRRWIGGTRDQLEARVQADNLGRQLDELRPSSPDATTQRLFGMLGDKQRALVWTAKDEGSSTGFKDATAAQRWRLDLAQKWLSHHAQALALTDPQQQRDALAKLDAITRKLEKHDETAQADFDQVLPTTRTDDMKAAQEAESERQKPAQEEQQARLRRKAGLWLTDRLVYLVLASVATALGIVALYLPEAVWGSTKDWILAALWGVGLHQTGAGAADGIQGLWRKFQPAPEQE